MYGPAPIGCGQGGFYNDTRRDPSNDNNAAGKVAVLLGIRQADDHALGGAEDFDGFAESRRGLAPAAPVP